jgi:NAD(P)H-flavin reductase
MKSYSYIPEMVKIIARVPLSEDMVMLRVKRPADFNFLPGQFVLVSVFGFGEVPIGVASSPSEKKYLELCIRSAGTVTKKICSLDAGDEVGLNGPFGNGFPMTKIKGRDIVVVAGGMGIFPLRSLILLLGENKNQFKSLTVITGARTPAKLCFSSEYPVWGKFAKVFATVDSGDKAWRGEVGQITSLYKKAGVTKGSVMIVCGPTAMCPSIIENFAGKNVKEEDLYFDLERRMECGIGKCQHCTCGKDYTCLDGPTFSFKELKNNIEAFV